MKVACVVFLLLGFVSSNAIILPTYSMPWPCTGGVQEHIYLGEIRFGMKSTGVLRLRSSKPGDDCSVVLHPYSQQDGIIINVDENNMRSNLNKITLTDGFTTKTISGFDTISNRATYITNRLGADVTVKYEAKSQLYFDGFRLNFTAFRNGTNCKSSSMFYCDDSRCISKVFACDGYRHCDGFSDIECSVSVGAIIGYVLGSCILVVACVCLVVFRIRRKRRPVSVGGSSVGRSIAVVHPPPVSYPPHVNYPPPANYPIPANYPQTTMVNPPTYTPTYLPPTYPK